MQVGDVEVWQLVDERLNEVRRLPHEDLCRRSQAAPEVEVLERASGEYRRRTRVTRLPHDRLGIRVRVDAVGQRPRAEAAIIITSTGELAPEWSHQDDPPRGNPFAFSLRATLAGLALCALLLIVFILLT